ncbi:MAG: Rho termination factor N-terminal domain-containing protein, partial [bacterium]
MELDIAQLDSMNDETLLSIANELGISDAQSLNREELIKQIIQHYAWKSGLRYIEGVLEILPEGYGLIRVNSFRPSNEDVYVSASQIKKLGLKMGDVITGFARAPKETERYYGLLRVETINGLKLTSLRRRVDFDELVPVYPYE